MTRLTVVTDLETRPRTRADCKDGPRPCPWVSCRHHLYLEVRTNGSVNLNHPDKEPWELCDSCSLDVADRGEHTQEQIGELLGFNQQYAERLEKIAMDKVKSRLGVVTDDE